MSLTSYRAAPSRVNPYLWRAIFVAAAVCFPGRRPSRATGLLHPTLIYVEIGGGPASGQPGYVSRVGSVGKGPRRRFS